MRGTRELERRESKLVEYVRGVERGRMQLLLWPISRSVFFLLLLLLSVSESQSYRHFISLHVNSPQFMTIASCFPADCTCASIQRIAVCVDSPPFRENYGFFQNQNDLFGVFLLCFAKLRFLDSTERQAQDFSRFMMMPLLTKLQLSKREL